MRKSRSSALENDKAARQVYQRDREPPRIRKAKLCRTMQKRSKRKGLKYEDNIFLALQNCILYAKLKFTKYGSLITAVIAFMANTILRNVRFPD